jgi:hypothetical protein
MPYAIVKEMCQLDESTDSIMKWTTFHCNYSNVALKNNLSFEIWKQRFPDGSQTLNDILNTIEYHKSISSNYHSRATSRQYTSVEVQTDDKFVLRPNEGATLISSSSDEEAQTDIVHNVKDTPADEFPNDHESTKDTSVSTNLESIPNVEETPSTKEEVSDSNEVKRIIDLFTKSKTSSTNVTSEPAKSKAFKPRMSSTQLQHLINDLMIAIDSTQALSNKGRDNLALIKVLNSLQREQKTRLFLKNEYKPPLTQSLDSQVAIARKIQTTHDVVDVNNWQSGELSTCSPLCLLNFPPMMLTSDSIGDDVTCSIFLKYFTSVLNKDNLNEDDLHSVILELKDRLFKQGKPTTYTWAKNQIKIQSIKPQPFDLSKPERIQTAWLLSNHTNHECPELDAKTQSYIDSHLDALIAKALKDVSLNSLNPPTGFGAHELFSVLVTEFISHTNAWNNPNSFASSKQLLKMENYLDVAFPQDQIDLIFTIMTKIINDFRSLTKLSPT